MVEILGGAGELIEVGFESGAGGGQWFGQAGSVATAHGRLEELFGAGGSWFVSQTDPVGNSVASEYLFGARQGGFGDGDLGYRAAVVGDELVGAIQVGGVGGYPHAGSDAGRVDRGVLGDEAGQVVLVQAAGSEDPYFGQAGLVEQSAGVEGQLREVSAVEADPVLAATLFAHGTAGLVDHVSAGPVDRGGPWAG